MPDDETSLEGSFHDMAGEPVLLDARCQFDDDDVKIIAWANGLPPYKVQS